MKNEYYDFLNTNKSQFLDDKHAWLVRQIYHYTNIDNALRILKTGALYSRNLCLQKGLMKNENASTEVLSQTDGEIKDYVRLYFRPKTPTQYHNEGFLSQKERKFKNAHVPVPIFFAFRSYEVLNMPNVSFSNQSLATHNYKIMQGIQNFKRLDFKKIYHEGSLYGLDEDEKNDILHKRQAEIITKDCLSLEHLDYIWTRSNAEYVTLINYLKKLDLFDAYKNKIMLKNNAMVFYQRGMFISDVCLEKDLFTVQVKNTYVGEHINMKAIIEIDHIKYAVHWIIASDITSYYCDLTALSKIIDKANTYEVTISFEQDEVYYGVWQNDDELPF